MVRAVCPCNTFLGHGCGCPPQASARRALEWEPAAAACRYLPRPQQSRRPHCRECLEVPPELDHVPCDVAVQPTHSVLHLNKGSVLGPGIDYRRVRGLVLQAEVRVVAGGCFSATEAL